MKKRFTLLIAMMMLLTAIATNVFASAANNNSKVNPKEWQEWFNGLSKEEQLNVNYELVQTLRLSDKDIEWLNWYNTLSKEEQLAVNYFPSQLLKDFLNKIQNKLGDKFESNKVGFAKKFINNMRLDNCKSILDLDSNMKKIIKIIKTWN